MPPSDQESPQDVQAEAWLQEVLEDELDRDYLVELSRLQVELLKLQAHVIEKNLRLAILFEGRDTAGKGGAILRLSQRLRPRHLRVVALPKPTVRERHQWYFERYVRELPGPGEMTLFDRSWYNRAVVEPVMKFCTAPQHELFMNQVVPFEQMLLDDGLILVKLWFSIDREEQERRINGRKQSPLKRWKLSPVDLQAQQYWESFTHHKEEMFRRTNTEASPWIMIHGNQKKRARLESIRYVLSTVDYKDRGQEGLRLEPDTRLVHQVKIT